jgi:hypothetical protein
MTADVLLAVALAGLATLIAAGMIVVPTEFTSSSVIQAILLLVALSLFAYSPVVGIAGIALFAVVIFHRNVQKTISYSAVPKYGDETIYQEHVKTQPFVSMASSPNPYPPASQQVWGVEGFEAATYADVTPSVDGQFPLPAPSLEGGVAIASNYAPDQTMGTNEFQRFGPDLEQKLQPLAYA